MDEKNNNWTTFDINSYGLSRESQTSCRLLDSERDGQATVAAREKKRSGVIFIVQDNFSQLIWLLETMGVESSCLRKMCVFSFMMLEMVKQMVQRMVNMKKIYLVVVLRRKKMLHCWENLTQGIQILSRTKKTKGNQRNI